MKKKIVILTLKFDPMSDILGKTMKMHFEFLTFSIGLFLITQFFSKFQMKHPVLCVNIMST